MGNKNSLVATLYGKDNFKIKVITAICNWLSINDADSIALNGISYQTKGVSNMERFGVNATICDVTFSFIAMMNCLTDEVIIEQVRLIGNI